MELDSNVLKRYFALIALCTAVAALAAWLAGIYLAKPVFRSRATLIVGSGEKYGEVESAALLDPNSIKAFSELVLSNSVIEGAVEKSNLSLAEKELQNSIDVDIDYDTGVIDLSVDSHSAKQSKLIAEAFIQSLREQAEKFILNVGLYTIDAPEPATVPVNRSAGLSVLLAAAGGFMSGAVIAVFLNAGAQTAGMISKFCEKTGLFLLGCLPSAEKGGFHALCSAASHNSKAEEPVKMIRTNLLYLLDKSGDKKLMITSPLPAEGKTTAAVKVASSASGINKKVLLIDCNFKSPALFKISRSEKLSKAEKLRSYRHVNGVTVKHVESLGIDVITHIMLSRNRTDSGLEFLRSNIDALESAYDLIIIDCPASLPFADSLIISSVVKNVVIVTDRRKCTGRALSESVNGFLKINANVLGLVVNRMPLKTV